MNWLVPCLCSYSVFLVRHSESIPNVFVLSFTHNQKVKHCTICKVGVINIQSDVKCVFSSLFILVHCVSCIILSTVGWTWWDVIFIYLFNTFGAPSTRVKPTIKSKIKKIKSSRQSQNIKTPLMWHRLKPIPWTYLPSVFWHCWLGHLTRKNPSRYDL